jgi:hypothetical protein
MRCFYDASFVGRRKRPAEIYGRRCHSSPQLAQRGGRDRRRGAGSESKWIARWLIHGLNQILIQPVLSERALSPSFDILGREDPKTRELLELELRASWRRGYIAASHRGTRRQRKAARRG